MMGFVSVIYENSSSDFNVEHYGVSLLAILIKLLWNDIY